MTAKSSPIQPILQKIIGFFQSETLVYVVRRLLQASLTMLLASALSFFIIQLAPGDYLDVLRQNPQISEETIKGLEQRFGLDKPIMDAVLFVAETNSDSGRFWH